MGSGSGVVSVSCSQLQRAFGYLTALYFALFSSCAAVGAFPSPHPSFRSSLLKFCETWNAVPLRCHHTVITIPVMCAVAAHSILLASSASLFFCFASAACCFVAISFCISTAAAGSVPLRVASCALFSCRS